MEKVELLPCPFCNGAAVISVSVGGYLFGECTSDECGAGGARCDTEAEAIAAWNARADADRIEALTAENERLRELLAVERMPKCFSCGIDVRQNCHRPLDTPCGREATGGTRAALPLKETAETFTRSDNV